MDRTKILRTLTSSINRIQLYEMRLEAVLDKLQRLIDRGDARMADLARFLDKNWNQCHEWVVKRNHLPNAEVALGIMHFIAIYDKTAGKQVQYNDDRKIIVDGRELTETEQDLWMENQMLKTMLASQINSDDS